MNVDSIRNGIVIDHIKAGLGMKLYDLLELGKLEYPVAMITKVTSKKMGERISSRSMLSLMSIWISSAMLIPVQR